MWFKLALFIIISGLFPFLTLLYSPSKVLDRASFAVKEEQLAVVLGASGAGKSTALNSRAKWIEPTAARSR